ncbi:MAG: hypothetical protein IPL79_15585 [Myxococcales bacterium]|nr:hypothetical protein [Myxococcales bacterium]
MRSLLHVVAELLLLPVIANVAVRMVVQASKPRRVGAGYRAVARPQWPGG